MFVGPSGVGKTELAYCIAELLFDNRASLIKVDMTEFQEKFSASKLIGAPPGYVGYEEGGQLCEMVRRKPYSVVLMDEVEKAHPDIMNLLLQVMDEGQLTDNNGKIVDFRNVLLIMTTNAGSKSFKENKSLGFNLESDDDDKKSEKLKKEVVKGLDNFFKPEFMNRTDDVILFNPLSKESIRKIIAIQVEEFIQRLEEKSITVEVDESIYDYILEKCYNKELGARPIKRGIQEYLEDKISSEMIAGNINSGEHISLYIKGDEIKFRQSAAVCP
ncbi:MAG: ATP-dependent Clp protease ATP-binding subunit [Nitrospinae bacterium]|nr:ATP-dependent Clp protease ATP-binding subunit [Nitrospinota bacterium]